MSSVFMQLHVGQIQHCCFSWFSTVSCSCEGGCMHFAMRTVIRAVYHCSVRIQTPELCIVWREWQYELYDLMRFEINRTYSSICMEVEEGLKYHSFKWDIALRKNEKKGWNENGEKNKGNKIIGNSENKRKNSCRMALSCDSCEAIGRHLVSNI